MRQECPNESGRGSANTRLDEGFLPCLSASEHLFPPDAVKRKEHILQNWQSLFLLLSQLFVKSLFLEPFLKKKKKLFYELRFLTDVSSQSSDSWVQVNPQNRQAASQGFVGMDPRTRTALWKRFSNITFTARRLAALWHPRARSSQSSAGTGVTCLQPRYENSLTEGSWNEINAFFCLISEIQTERELHKCC